MQIVVAYDVNTETAAGRRRLRKVAQICLNFGQRVQKSVFECQVNQAQLEQLIRQLRNEIDEGEDSLRLYRIMEPRDRHTYAYGIQHVLDFQEPLIL
ncbi:CRISPR-associated endonuclease Cas2 [Caldinitratiruptor microaerophilus]|uniref:CRISPR-associated endoribonuclease Cas2 n=1 Tax=Caldinitratiruptor microaerophilus TaxID=671077 RepID=A0AA35CL44_9FIRM|nr:CRISPR-associated endonuclease Cas2 [Caldinitratiruptor microaerophilus]BDG59305.1 CRISPR-associated endoribonuclease Cas2 1 [Caldinitratiruptor microaerophilus]